MYCKACLKNYFEIQIRVGQVQCLNYPGLKCSLVATPGQVKGLVKANICPLWPPSPPVPFGLKQMWATAHAQAASRHPGCTMCICSSCTFAFCTLYKLTYHGVFPWKVPAGLWNAYLQIDKAKRLWELRYDKRVIRRHRSWHVLTLCNISTGLVSLPRANPYKHFTHPASLCCNWLFHFADVNGDIWEDEIEDSLTPTAQDVDME